MLTNQLRERESYDNNMGNMTTHERAYKFRFYPDAAQEELLRRAVGCTRLVWNKSLERIMNRAENEKVNLNANLTSMKKDEDYAFLREVSSVPLQQSIRHLIIRTAFNNGSTDILDLRDAFNANNVNMSRFDWMLGSCLKWTHAHTNMVLFYLNHMDEIDAYQLQSHDADMFIDCIQRIGFIQNDNDGVVPVIDDMIPLMNSMPAFKSVKRMIPVLSHIAAITSRELYIEYYEITPLFHYIMDYYPNEISVFIDDMIMMPLEYVGQSWLMAINDWKHDNDWQGI